MPSGVIGVSPIPRRRFPNQTKSHAYDDTSFAQPANDSNYNRRMSHEPNYIFSPQKTNPYIEMWIFLKNTFPLPTVGGKLLAVPIF